MQFHEINVALLYGKIDEKGVLPHIESLTTAPFKFEVDFGLRELPQEPGLLLIRGARQYGKSTWLEQQLAETIKTFGPGSAFYINGDALTDYKSLIQEIRFVNAMFSINTPIKRIFIDEITAIDNWEKALKLLIDAGELRNVLIVTTGSKAADLRIGSERLPGRKGKLARSTYIFTPISYATFKKHCGHILGPRTLSAYALSGGSPIACTEITERLRIPEYVIELTSDWILGEFTASGRTRSALLSVLNTLYKFGNNPIGQAKLAREAGLANNSVAQGYIALLQDLLCIIPAYPRDVEKNQSLWRKPCKYHFINTLAATAWHPKALLSPDELDSHPEEQGQMMEWLVAQELWRRQCIEGKEPVPEELHFWASKTHELDFVLPNNRFIEVKRGAENPYNYAWFLQTHSKGYLTIINNTEFETERIRGITLENFMLNV